MTGYYITVGYNSRYDKENVWKKLKEVVENICFEPSVILTEVLRFDISGLLKNTDLSELKEYAQSYKDQNDVTIKIVERTDSDGKAINSIDQLASGGGIERKIKEHFRRAFCRLVLNEMHANNMEININVS